MTRLKTLTSSSPRNVTFRFPNEHASGLRLVPHQQALLHACSDEIEDRLRLATAVMNDPPGSGKTLVLLAMVCRDLMAPNSKPKSKSATVGTTLVVVPFNIYTQWVDTARACCGDRLRVVPVVDYSSVSSLLFSPDLLAYSDLIITTSVYYSSIVAIMRQQGYRVKRLVIDEVDRTSWMLSADDLPNCDHLWLLSASLQSAQDCARFEPVIRRRSRDGSSQDLTFVKCEDEFVRSSFSIPSPEITYVISNRTHVDFMSGLVNHDVLDAANACAYDDARLMEAAGLSCTRTVSSAKDLIKVMLSNHVNGAKEARARLEDFGKVCKDFLHDQDEHRRALENELRRHEEFVARMGERLRQDDICSICMEDIGAIKIDEDETKGEKAAVVVACCFNRFCLSCMQQWLRFKNACPLCNAQLRKDNMCTIVDDKVKQNIRADIQQAIDADRRETERRIKTQDSVMYHFLQIMRGEGGGKGDALFDRCHVRRSVRHDDDKAGDVIDIVLERLGRRLAPVKIDSGGYDGNDDAAKKIMIFSDRSAVFRAVARRLDALGISHSELDGGNIRDMDAIVRRYKHGDLTILMANSNMFDCGMNLENTTDIVFVHQMTNKARFLQVLGRAQRYGRRNRLQVWQLYHENEMHQAVRRAHGVNGDDEDDDELAA